MALHYMWDGSPARCSRSEAQSIQAASHCCYVSRVAKRAKRDDVGTVIAQTFRADRSLSEEASYQQCVAASLNGVAVSRVSLNVSSIANTLRARLVEARS
jgi:hypothetical protein